MSGNKLLTSDDLELKGSIVRKRNRSQQSQKSLEDDSSEASQNRERGISLNDLPSDVIENILSHFSYRKMLDLRLVSKRWNSVILAYVEHSQNAFKHYLEEFEFEWLNLSTSSEEMVRNNPCNPGEIVEHCPPFKLPSRFNQNALYHSGFMYIFGGMVSFQSAFNDLWRFDLQRKKWQRIIVNGDIPTPKQWTALHFYEFEDEVTKQKRPSFIQMGHISLFPKNSFNATQERQLEQREFSLIYVFDIETFTWRKLEQKGDLRVTITGKFASFIIADEFLILCGAVTNLNCASFSTSLEYSANTKAVVHSFNLKTSTWTVQRSSEDSYIRSHYESTIPLNEHTILCHNQGKLFIMERNRCEICEKCRSMQNSRAHDKIGCNKSSHNRNDDNPPIVWNTFNCDVKTAEGDIRMFFQAKSAVYFKIGNKFGVVVLRQIKLKLPPPGSVMPLPSSKPAPRISPVVRDGERLAVLERHMSRIRSKLDRQEVIRDILDIEFFDVEQVLKEHILKPICDQSGMHPKKTKLFTSFSRVSFGSSYLPTVTSTPEGLLIFGGNTSIGDVFPLKCGFFMLVGRPNLNRLTSQMEYK